MSGLQIKSVEFLDDFQIEILLSTEERVICDIKPKLETARFKDLEDPGLFQSGRLLNGRLIRWNASTELSLHEMLASMKRVVL